MAEHWHFKVCSMYLSLQTLKKCNCKLVSCVCWVYTWPPVYQTLFLHCGTDGCPLAESSEIGGLCEPCGLIDIQSTWLGGGQRAALAACPAIHPENGSAGTDRIGWAQCETTNVQEPDVWCHHRRLKGPCGLRDKYTELYPVEAGLPCQIGEGYNIIRPLLLVWKD